MGGPPRQRQPQHDGCLPVHTAGRPELCKWKQVPFDVKGTLQKKLWVETSKKKLGERLMEQFGLSLLFYFWVRGGRQKRRVCVGLNKEGDKTDRWTGRQTGWRT